MNIVISNVNAARMCALGDAILAGKKKNDVMGGARPTSDVS